MWFCCNPIAWLRWQKRFSWVQKYFSADSHSCNLKSYVTSALSLCQMQFLWFKIVAFPLAIVLHAVMMWNVVPSFPWIMNAEIEFYKRKKCSRACKFIFHFRTNFSTVWLISFPTALATPANFIFNIQLYAEVFRKRAKMFPEANISTEICS